MPEPFALVGRGDGKLQGQKRLPCAAVAAEKRDCAMRNEARDVPQYAAGRVGGRSRTR